VLVIEIPTSQIACGFLVFCPIKGEAIFTGDGFRYDMTRQGNPQPGTDDKADAVVIGLAGQIISERQI
jgi:hypothetical protein